MEPRLIKACVIAACSLFITGWTTTVLAERIHNVASADDFEELMESKVVAAGDTILWADGDNRDAEVNIEGIAGTKAMPITLKSATPGGVVFRGESQMRVGADWWVIQGFHFDGGEKEINSYNSFQFRSNSGKPSQHVRLTDCAFTNLKTEDETSKWLQLYGQYNIIDHCHFSGKQSKGALVTVELAYIAEDETAGHQITRNYFGSFSPQEGNDNETIRIGSSEDQAKSARCVVRENYFVRCDGENEIISNKSSHNVIERNTFRQCNGAVVLRHGHHARVEGNFFFGDGAINAGGIRIVDSHHVIVNNYLQDLSGQDWNAALSILGGKQKSGGSENGYQAVDDISVLYNSIINCRQSLLLNKKKGARPPTGVIANNLFSSDNAPLVTANLSTEKLTFSHNVMHGADAGIEVESITADPVLSQDGELLRPSATGSVVDAAAEVDTVVDTDIDGQIRPKQGTDIGADEVSGAIGEVTSVPLTPADVGVSFLRGDGPSDIKESTK